MNDQKGTVQDFFLNLGVVVTLYTVVISFLSLTFDVINKLFPDNLGYSGDYYSTGVRMAMASLIIVFPLFVWLSFVVSNMIRNDVTRAEVAVRRWLVYITLFLSSTVLIVDLVVLLNTFLGGEISTRFILKVIAVLLVAGIVFTHYFSVIKKKNSPAKLKLTIYGSSILVLALIVTAFSVFGSPANMRKQRADDLRLNNLAEIQSQIVNYWQLKGKIPDKLEELSDTISGFSAPVDPETGDSYTYEKTGVLSFNLCSDFYLKSSKDSDMNRSYGYGYYPFTKSSENNSWKHDAGNQCFKRIIDSELYPSNSPNLPTPKGY